MEPGAATVAAAAAAAAPDVVTILGIMLNTDQIIAATHAAIALVIGLGQIVAISVGIWLMAKANNERSAEYSKRHQQTMDDQQKRHDEAMAAHQQTMAAHQQAMAAHQQAMAAHRQTMGDQKQRHDEVMAAQQRQHEQSMKALEELIRRTAPRRAES